MNQPLYICVVFLFVAFVYIHVLFHLKVNNLLDVRTIQITGKEDFEEQCDKRLPFISYYNNLIMNNTFSPSHLLKNYKSFQLNSDVPEKIGDIFEKDNFLTSDNEAFLSESDTLMKINTEDNFLRPSFTCYKNYDLTMGKNTTTNFVSPLCFRTFLYICHGNRERERVREREPRRLTSTGSGGSNTPRCGSLPTDGTRTQSSLSRACAQRSASNSLTAWGLKAPTHSRHPAE